VCRFALRWDAEGLSSSNTRIEELALNHAVFFGGRLRSLRSSGVLESLLTRDDELVIEHDGTRSSCVTSWQREGRVRVCACRCATCADGADHAFVSDLHARSSDKDRKSYLTKPMKVEKVGAIESAHHDERLKTRGRIMAARKKKAKAKRGGRKTKTAAVAAAAPAPKKRRKKRKVKAKAKAKKAAMPEAAAPAKKAPKRRKKAKKK
jgi:hypothetical protein